MTNSSVRVKHSKSRQCTFKVTYSSIKSCPFVTLPLLCKVLLEIISVLRVIRNHHQRCMSLLWQTLETSVNPGDKLRNRNINSYSSMTTTIHQPQKNTHFKLTQNEIFSFDFSLTKISSKRMLSSMNILTKSYC